MIISRYFFGPEGEKETNIFSLSDEMMMHLPILLSAVLIFLINHLIYYNEKRLKCAGFQAVMRKHK